MKFGNYMILDFPSKSTNEAFARSAVACFASQMDPTLEELGDIRTAVSEAVTNCIVHAYPEALGNITLRCRTLKDNILARQWICGSPEKLVIAKAPGNYIIVVWGVVEFGGIVDPVAQSFATSVEGASIVVEHSFAQ